MAMSQAYTPGLKIKYAYLVQKERKLPVAGEVLVEKGEEVTQDRIVARTYIPGNPTVVKVASILGVELEDVPKLMLMTEGDSVKEGEPIAHYKAFFGLINKFCPSPITGVVEKISKYTGQVIVRENPKPVYVQAYIPGKVVKVLPKEGVVIETPAAFVQGIFGIGGETWGELMMAVNKPEDVLTPEKITAECEGKVLVGGSLVTLESLQRAIKNGVKGIVVGGISDEDLKHLLGHEIGVAITGTEDVGLTLIITEGFDRMRMFQKTFNIFKTFEGKLACINGATQIRAGVVRPEIIIPRSDLDRETIEKLRNEEEAFHGGLLPGASIRIIRDPYFGALGKVINLPAELQVIETESEVRVLEVKLEDGRRVLVPRANVEIIEE